MRSADVGASRSTVPAFLTKLWRLVEDANFNELIAWNENGLSFIIKDQTRFSKEVLPMYFKHSNMASFIRQLNMYGFHKLVKIEQGGMRCESDEMEFFHHYFLKGQPALLELIKRKQVSKDDAKIEAVKTLMTDVKNLQGKQENVDSMMSSMKRENEALWREVAYLRQKHLKQQQIVEKLIQFLVTLVQPNVNVSLKRKLPLMINNASGGDSKIQRLTRKNPEYHYNTNREDNGPVIHDVTELLATNSEPTEGGFPATSGETPIANILSCTDPVVQSPAEIHLESPHNIPIASPLGDMEALEPLSILEPLQPSIPLSPTSLCNESIPENIAAEADFPLHDIPLNTPLVTVNDPPEFPKNAGISEESGKKSDGETENLMQVALTEPSTSMKDPNNKAALINDRLSTIESELDWLQEQLSSNSLNLDASTLLGVRGCWDPSTSFKLFGGDDSVLGNNLPESLRLSSGEITGNEVIQYAPSLFDLDFNDDEFSLGSTDGDKQSGSVQGTSNPDLEKLMDGLLNEKQT